MPRGIFRISSDGDDKRIILGLIFSIPEKFEKYFFGGLIKQGFFGFQNNLKIRGSVHVHV